jgi:hypothetical protein
MLQLQCNISRSMEGVAVYMTTPSGTYVMGSG